MKDQDTLIKQLSYTKRDILPRMKKTGEYILELSWRYRNADFQFSSYPRLEIEVNTILQELSDGNMLDAQSRARRVLLELELDEYYNDAMEFAKEKEYKEHNALWSLDMASTHYKSILETWVKAAFITKASLSALQSQFVSFLELPYLSKMWKDAGFGKPHFGKGYQDNILDGIALIEQDIIVTATRFAQIRSFGKGGAIGYRTVRASTFHCPYCDEMSTRIWRIDDFVLPYHPRCVCYPVPVYQNEL